MAEAPYTPPPFGDEWKRVHTRIHPYLDRTSDFWRVKLTGRNDKVLLDFEVGYHSSLAHRSFYKEFLEYLKANLWSVDGSALSFRELDALYDSLLGFVCLCKGPVLSLPGHVVEELFADVEGEIKAADVRDDEEEDPPTPRDDE